MYTDPTGHWKFKEWAGQIIGGIVGAITFVATGGNIALTMAAYGFVSSSISTYQAGNSVGQSIGMGMITGSAAMLGAGMGSAFGKAIGGGAFGAALLGGAAGGAAGGATYAGLVGGNVGRAAAAGAAGGTIAGIGGFAGGIFAPAGVLAGGGVASEIAGSKFSYGVRFSIVAAVGSAMRAGNFQVANDTGRTKGSTEGVTISGGEIVKHIMNRINEIQQGNQSDTFKIMLAEVSDEQLRQAIPGIVGSLLPPPAGVAATAITPFIKAPNGTPQSTGGSQTIIPYNPNVEKWDNYLEQEIRRKEFIEDRRGNKI